MSYEKQGKLADNRVLIVLKVTAVIVAIVLLTNYIAG